MQVKNIRKNYTVNPSDKILFVHTAVPITITLPKQIPNDVTFVILGSGTESINNITIAYPNQSNTVISTDSSITVITHIGNDLFIVNSAGGSGGGGDTGWFLQADASRLNDALGLAVENVGLLASNADFLTLVDASAGNVTADLTTLESGSKIIKNIKVTGPFNLILDSTAGFSDGTNELIVSDSCIIFWDSVSGFWQIVYNNEWKTKVVDVSSGEILAMGTTPIELLPPPGIGKYYEIESILTKYTHVATAYPTLASLAYYLGLSIDVVTIIDMISVASNSINQSISFTTSAVPINQSLNLTTNDFSDPTLGDGTLQAIIKYKVNTF